ncbi:TetR/AcrR family transcriptional regulator [Paracoccus xiamenensis]|uniref:TetR/AcrR family transcriptional regulator n=1 Tax=Paracoccus xiamenensis TaxID=2714901 RepID=UPI00140C75E0|nr:TetR/AcrR family transcriptional regulator [Paracoccus xiamenensis]NHF71754.1 TetR/AcrR family transcriptional regulator [Paracoccus xiamenensis]
MSRPHQRAKSRDSSKPGAKASRARRTREELRQATLDAAREIITQDGPEALTARRLAQAVGYTPGTIYNLFDSLPDVLWQVNRDNFARIAELFADLPGDDPAARLRALCRRYLDLVEAEPMVFRALFEGPRRSELFPEWYLNAIADLLARVAEEIRTLAPAMPLETAKSETTALFAAIQGIAQLRSSGRLELLTPVSATDLADSLVTRILRDAATQNG